MACATFPKCAARIRWSQLDLLRYLDLSFKYFQTHSIGLQSMPTRRFSVSNPRSCKRSTNKFPEKPTAMPFVPDHLSEVPEIDLALVEQLERMSLVEFANEKGLTELQNAVRSGNWLHLTDTEGVEPLDSVLEDRPLWLREDGVTEGDCVEEILSNASKVEEQYFVAPPGNIPLKNKHKERFSAFLEKESKTGNLGS